MAISTIDCKKAIVAWVISHPGHVSNEFDPPECELAAQLIENWKRESKRREGKGWLRGFDCRPYNAQLRAYVIDNGQKILSVCVQGE